MKRARPCLCLLLWLAWIPAPPAAAQDDGEAVRDLRDELFLAIELNDLAAARKALVDGAMTEVSFGNPSPLGTAAELGSEAMVALLLQAGGDPSRTLDNPLRAAVRGDHFRMVKMLLQAGAPVPGPGMSEDELFARVLLGDHFLEISRELLQKGASPDPGLRLAISNNRREAAELFLDHGADVSLLPPEVNLLALANTPEETAGFLERGVRDSNRDGALAYFLVAAIESGEQSSVELAVARGATVRYEDLERAARVGRDGVVVFLLDRIGEEIEDLAERAEEEDSEELLAYLSRIRRERFLELALPVGLGVAAAALLATVFLLGRGAFVRSPRRVHEAVARGDLKRLEKLLGRGADPNCWRDGYQPLHVAAENDHLKVVRALVQHGAQINRRAADDLGFAPLHIAASVGSIAMVELFLRNGASPDVRDEAGQTPLYIAATAGNSEMVGLLVERGADLNAKLGDGESLLVSAILGQDADTARVLLAAGADPDAESGRAPLHAAAKVGDVEMTALLLERGADPNAVDPSAATPLEVALRQQHDDVAHVLRRGGAREHIRSGRGGAPAAALSPAAAPPPALGPPPAAAPPPRPASALAASPAASATVPLAREGDIRREVEARRPVGKPAEGGAGALPPAPTMIARPASAPSGVAARAATPTMRARPSAVPSASGATPSAQPTRIVRPGEEDEEEEETRPKPGKKKA